MGVVNRRAEHRSDLVVLDAQRMDAGPLATVRVPVRLKYGDSWQLGAERA